MKRLTLTLTAALFLSSPAYAADGPGWKVGNDSFHIYYSDLDMNTAAGRAAMLERVEKAARKLCDSRLKADEEDCVAATIAQAAARRGGEQLARALAEDRQVRMAGR
jgi:UrcA family protein